MTHATWPRFALLLIVGALTACGSRVESAARGTTDPGAGSSDDPAPTEPLADPGVRLAQGPKAKCVKNAAGSVTCFGYYAGDPLGVTPVTLEGVDDAVAVTQWYEQGCLLHATGKVSCWGW